ncbi:MAG: MFS transporter [Acidimicrobiia bacterium]|nr:MFS transporter [Acidimicrobiia bacterium]MDX2467854.1 MFS transporter [Acidimicrobiia bacterium]
MPHRSARFRASLGYLSGLRLIINTAARFVSFFLPAIARGLGVPLEQAGDLISIRWAAGLPTPFFMTAMSRGRPRRNLIGLGLGLFAVGSLITAATSVYVGAVVGFIMMGVAKPLFDVSSQAYLADRVPYDKRGRVLGIFELTWAGGLLVGAPLAGWMIRTSGWRSPFWLLGGLLAVGALAMGRLLDKDTGDVHGSEGRLRLDRPSAAFLVVAALYAMAAELMFVVLGAWLEDSFGLSLVAAGGIAVFIGLAELSGEAAMTAFSDRIGKRRSVVAGILIAAAGFAAFAVASASLAGGVAAAMLAYFGFELAIVSGVPYASEIHPHARARFLAWMVVGWSLGRTLGSAIGPRLYVGSGIATAALVAAALNLAAVAVFAWGGAPDSAVAERFMPNSEETEESER